MALTTSTLPTKQRRTRSSRHHGVKKMHPIFERQNQEQTALTCEDDLNFEAGFKKVDCIIYVYCKPGTNIVVYVGQTRVKLKTRDKQHLAGRKQEFEKVYTSKSKFELKALEKKTFTANIQSKSDDERFIKSYGGWMDEREKYYIKHYDTYVDPKKFPEKWLDTQWDKLNRDPGGRGLALHVRNAQSALKKSLNTFRTKYWPLMQAFLETERAKLPCGTPSLMMVERKESIIGILINGIRTGNTSVPALYKKKMLEHGHVDNYYEGMWKHVYWPAMLAFLKTEKAKLPCGTPSLLMVTQKEPIIGILINGIRTGNTSVPALYKKKMLEHGYVDNHSEGMWKQVYIPLVEAFLETKEAKLPVSGTPALLMKKMNIRKDKISILLNHIRTGHSSLPARYKKMFDENGMFWSTSNVAKHVLRKMGILRYVSRGKFEIDRNVSLDPAENEDIAVCLEELRCFLLDEKISGRRFIMASKKYTCSREKFIDKYRKDLQKL